MKATMKKSGALGSATICFAVDVRPNHWREWVDKL